MFGAKEKASSADIKDAVKVISDIGIEQNVRNAARKYMNDALK